jgi:glycosyltransferase involved in cell wall biosynthesis
MIKVLQVCFVYPPSFSGYGRQLYTVNKELMALDEEVSITVLTAYGGQETFGIHVKSMLSKIRNAYKYEKIIFFCFSFFFMLRCFWYFKKYDVYHVVKAGPETIIPSIFAKVFNKKLIVKVAQDDVKPSDRASVLQRALRYSRNFFLKKADTIIAISDSIVLDLIKIGYPESQVSSIPNSVDTERFKPVSSTEREFLMEKLSMSIYDECVVLLFVGAISKRKGIDDLLNAIDLAIIEQDTLFLLVGPLYDVSNFEKRIIELNEKKEKISIVYRDFSESISDYYKISDFLILPSYSEGMPNVVLEAIASDVPVILSDIPIHKQLCIDPIGTTFELGNFNSLASILEDVSNGELKKDEFRPREIAENKYSLPRVSEKYFNLYKDKSQR